MRLNEAVNDPNGRAVHDCRAEGEDRKGPTDLLGAIRIGGEQLVGLLPMLSLQKGMDVGYREGSVTLERHGCLGSSFLILYDDSDGGDARCEAKSDANPNQSNESSHYRRWPDLTRASQKFGSFIFISRVRMRFMAAATICFVRIISTTIDPISFE